MTNDIDLSRMSNAELKEINCIKINGEAICGICGKKTSIIRMTDLTPICSSVCLGHRRNPRPFELWSGLDGKEVQIIGIAKCVDENRLRGKPILYARMDNDGKTIGIHRNSNGEFIIHIDNEDNKNYIIIQTIGSKFKNRMRLQEMPEFMGRDGISNEYRYTLKTEWKN